VEKDLEEYENALLKLVVQWKRENELEKLYESEMSPFDRFNSLFKDEFNSSDEFNCSFEDEVLDNQTSLYRYFNNKDELLYVGVSCSAINRYSQHKIRPKWAKDGAILYIEQCDSRDLALDAENKAIKTEYPKYNIQHNNGKRPWELGWDVTICSFRKKNGEFGLRINNSPCINELYLETDKMDAQIIDIGRNAWILYKVFCFKPWEDMVIEIEVKALMSIFRFKYRIEDFEYFSKLVIEPALVHMKELIYSVEGMIKELEDTVKMNAYCPGKHLTYIIKKTEGYAVFVNNKEPPSELEVQADKLGIDRDDLKTYEMVKRMLYPNEVN
jgi:predicted GIY-YIG superfamily endonuclease